MVLKPGTDGSNTKSNLPCAPRLAQGLVKGWMTNASCVHNLVRDPSIPYV